MKLEIRDDGITVVLSRRNLNVLLAKLDGNPPGSACTIVGGDDAPSVRVRAEEDTAHYNKRPPGVMHPHTETAVTSHS